MNSASEKNSIRQIIQNSEVKREEPIPLLEGIPEDIEFPVDALGPILGAAASAIAECVQCPKAIAGQSVLSAASLAVQSFADVTIDGRHIPLSLYCLTIAESGDRKSAADNLALKMHKEVQRELWKQYEQDKDLYQNALDAYNKERESILRQKNQSKDECAQLLNSLEKPLQPVEPLIIAQEPTLEALQKAFLFGRSSMGLFNNEGGQFFGGHAMGADNMLKSIAGLSLFWDGADIVRTRSGKGESGTLVGKRLTVHLMAQPVIADRIIGDSLMQGQGFLPRFLISMPQSNAGTRLYKFKDASRDPGLNLYWEKSQIALDKPLPDVENETRPKIHLEPKAKELWIKAYNHIEENIGKDKELFAIKAMASKAAESILRIAGVMSLIEDLDSSCITSEQMERAIELEAYYIKEALRVHEKCLRDSELEKAFMLLEWMKSSKKKIFSVREISRNGPRSSGVRNGAKTTRKVISLLVEYNWLIPIQGGIEINKRYCREAWRLNCV